MILYYCKRCGCAVEHKFGSGKFCSRACANSRTFSEESNLKRSKSNSEAYNKNPELRRISSETMKKNNRTFSSNKRPSPCGMKGKHLSEGAKRKISEARKGKRLSEETKQKLRAAALKNVANGTHKGWQTRNISSYAEKFWVKVLTNNNISFEREYVVKYDEENNKHYFLDFLIKKNGKNIDLEIDGKQHQYEDRKEHDKLRDERISNLGFEIYRVAWNEVNSENGKTLMASKIRDFLNFYQSL